MYLLGRLGDYQHSQASIHNVLVTSITFSRVRHDGQNTDESMLMRKRRARIAQRNILYSKVRTQSNEIWKRCGVKMICWYLGQTSKEDCALIYPR